MIVENYFVVFVVYVNIYRLCDLKIINRSN